jgi:TIR domain
VAYEYDVFISYRRRSPFHEWVRDLFHPQLVDALRKELPVEPRLFRDETEMEAGTRWSASLRAKLSRSRLVVAILSPPYFYDSKWCPAEWRTITAREQAAGVDLATSSLLIPVRFSDGDSFPAAARARQAHDLSRFNNLERGHRDSPLFLEFKDEMDVLARLVRDRLKTVPAWKNDWPEGSATRWPKPTGWRAKL